MSGTDAERRAGPSPSMTARATAAAMLERVAFGVLLVLIALRPLLAETTSYESPAWTRTMAVPAGPQPGTTLAFSGAIVGAGVLTLAARLLRGGRPWRATGGEAGAVLLLVAGIVSCAAAAQKRLAINGTISFLALIVLLLALRQLCEAAWRRRLVAAVVLASGAVFAVRCVYQIAVDYPVTREYYEEHRAEWVARAGEDGAGKLYDFEQRLKSNAATGYFAHANVAGGYLLLVVMTGLAVAADRREGSGGPIAWLYRVAPLLVALAAAVALALTRSKGAVGGLCIALCLWGVGWAARGWIQRHRRLSVVLLWLAALAGAGTVAGIGMARGGLPTLSLLYRWQYWRGAAEMIRDYGLLGVGCDNFGRLFTRYKPMECPEEVQDPHSWPVRLAAEWGVIGLAGMLLLLAGVSWRIAAARADRALDDEQGGAIRGWVLAAGAGAFVMWGLIYSDGDAAFLILLLLLPAVIWAPVALAVAAEGPRQRSFADRPTPSMTAPLAAGAVGFLAHAAFDIGLFVPGAATTLLAVMALASASAGGSSEDGAGRRVPKGNVNGRPGLAALLLVALVAGALWFAVRVLSPAAACAGQLDRARKTVADMADDWESLRGSPAYAAYARAAAHDPLDATAVEELLPQMLRRVRTAAHCDEVERWLGVLAKRDPRNPAVPRHWAVLWRMRFELTNHPAHLERAIGQLRRWIAAYPTWPPAHELLARFLLRLDEARPDPALRAEALLELRRALELEAGRIFVSPPNRMSAQRRAEIEAEIRRLEGSVTRPAGDP